MNITQIIILTILSIVMIICYFGTALTNNNAKRFGFIILWTFASAITMLIAILMTQEREHLLKEKDKCPKYEKIEAYRLKP
jgi:uncharacterized membrane protein YbhN (UPF0104 family)